MIFVRLLMPRRFMSFYGAWFFSLILVGCILIAAFFLPGVLSLDPYSTSEQLLHPPSFHMMDHFLGTDDLGRDVLARLVFGARNTVGIGLMVAIFSMGLGTLLGLLVAVYGGILDFLTKYCSDLIMSFPNILFTILLLTILGPGIATSVLAVTLVTIPGFIRVVKTVAVKEMKKEYILAARSFGFSRFKILTSELLPNCIDVMIVQATFAFGEALLTISVLGFLHLGVSPPMAEWGSMLADAYQFIGSAPYLVVIPGLCLFFLVFFVNLLGDQLLHRLPKS